MLTKTADAERGAGFSADEKGGNFFAPRPKTAKNSGPNFPPTPWTGCGGCGGWGCGRLEPQNLSPPSPEEGARSANEGCTPKRPTPTGVPFFRPSMRVGILFLVELWNTSHRQETETENSGADADGGGVLN